MTRWPLCWIWSCGLLVNSFATGLTLVQDLELMPDVTGNLFSWWSDGCLLRGSFGPALLVLACFVFGTLCWIGVEPVLRNKFEFEVGAWFLRSKFGSEVDACCNMKPVDDVWGVALYKVLMNYKIFSFYSGKFFYFLPNLIQVFWIMILSHFHLISDFYCPKQTTHHTWAPVLGPHQSSTFLGGAHCTLRCPHLRSGLLRSMLQGVVLGPVQS